jgi:uncharacterized protein (TIGR02145 family)
MKMRFICIIFLFAHLISCKKEKEEKKEIETSTVSDVEGNVYKTVKIGDQWWMAENLKVTKYNDGSLIAEVLDSENDTVWSNKTEGALYFNEINSSVLYNGLVLKDSRKVAPSGWHIPSDEEWKTLEKTMGMSSDEVEKTAWRGTNVGNKMTIKSSVGWPSASVLYGTNDFGFSAIPGGCVVYDGYKNKQGSMAFWWSSTSINDDFWYRYLDYQKSDVFRQHAYKKYGFNIRCIKD